MKISEVIRNYRKKENLTQEQVANYLNISAPAVNKWESGISCPDISLLAALARVLKIDEAYGVYEGILRKSAHETFTALSLIIQMLFKEKKFNEAEEYIDRAKKVADAFDLGAYHKYSLDLWYAREKKDKEKAIEMIINMVNEASSIDGPMNSNLYKHIKFNVNSSWDKDKYEKAVKGAFKKDKTLDFVKDDPRIKILLE
ncbi:helix-turn-helix domain-containing protein [Clostridium estertheticum]|uniref:helix-turn-helix domain-containing protein n=1 Tax=Clostridium estertheticum TaxID=238834 RepID=UPI00124E36DA|nr:helix-turn-helix transcriptional regulator [Clostridium estertheticum]MBU3171903.1 helix-turn-helix domain-containing protein [Clostridium estertheticum]MBZ9618353.1 helix-turn-helix domain-containing protein [Clostridium estertheticum subsp. laramiense]WAG76150.1 helix-turn-helix domain-containing protein [Clostridium estertheticum]